jgi:iron complex transport system substrate-binding protein
MEATKMKDLMKLSVMLMLFLSLALVILPSNAEVTVKEKILNITADSITVMDEVGRTVTINLPVQSIIATDARQMETLLAIGAEDMIVGVDVSYHTHYPFLGLKDAPEVSQHAKGVDYEKVLVQHPDLVVVPKSQGATADEISEKLKGIPVLAFDLGHRNHIIPEAQILGEILGKQTEAERLINWINKYDTIVDSRTLDLKTDEMPTYYYEATATSSKWKANVPISRAGVVAEGCGGRNIAADLAYNDTVSSLVVDPEWILTQNPDYIFLDFHSGKSGVGKTVDDVKEALQTMIDERAKDGIANVTAIRDNHVYAIDYDYVAGPRWIVGHVCFAKWLHPDLFADLDPEKINSEFLSEFLGVDNLEGTWVYPHP